MTRPESLEDLTETFNSLPRKIPSTARTGVGKLSNSTVQLRTRLRGAGVSSVLMVLVRNFFPSGKTWIYRVEFHEVS